MHLHNLNNSSCLTSDCLLGWIFLQIIINYFLLVTAQTQAPMTLQKVLLKNTHTHTHTRTHAHTHTHTGQAECLHREECLHWQLMLQWSGSVYIPVSLTPHD